MSPKPYDESATVAAEVLHLRAENARLRHALDWMVTQCDTDRNGAPSAGVVKLARAALDGSPAPRMYTEEQVRAAWKRANVGFEDDEHDFLYLEDFLKALPESP